MASTRLPGKAMLKIGGIPVLEHVIKRVKSAEKVDMVILATTCNQEDEILTFFAHQMGIKDWIHPDVDDVLGRFYQAAAYYGADNVIRITGDCPFIDPFWIDKCADTLENYHVKDLIYVTNIYPTRLLPDGLDVEGFNFYTLQRANEEESDPYNREHVCHWMAEHALVAGLVESKTDLSHHRWTLDTAEDYEWFCEVAGHIKCRPPHPTTEELLELIETHPELERTEK